MSIPFEVGFVRHTKTQTPRCAHESRDAEEGCRPV